jgi:hypothetical protein
MRYLAEFENWRSGFTETINEQATGSGKGFIVVFGSTDNDNLRAGAAEPLGFKENEIITGTINGMESMLKIGAAKSFQNANHPGKSVKPGVDYLNVTVNGKKYSIKEKGVLEIPFTKDTVLEIEGAGNGLLALMRALYYLHVSVTKNKFDYNTPFDGTLFIKIGETTRKGLSLSVNGKYDQNNGVRITSGYSDIMKKFVGLTEAVDFGDAPQQDSAVEQIVLTADTIADAIKAAHFYHEGQEFRSHFSAYAGFREMWDTFQKSAYFKKTPGIKKKDAASNFLAVAFQYAIARLSDFYPMDLTKIYKIDLEPYALKILGAQGSGVKGFNEASIRTNLTEMFKQFEPKELKDYPEFKGQLPKYWAVITDALVNRVIKLMPRTFDMAMTASYPGAPVATSGGIQTGRTEFGSGKIDN